MPSSRNEITTPDHSCHKHSTCPTFSALLDEVGDGLIDLYADKLLQRGWPGKCSPVEKSYIQAHRSEDEQRIIEAASRRLIASRFSTVAGYPNPKADSRAIFIERVALAS